MNNNYVIGIDLGGTNTVIGIVDVKGHILGIYRFKSKGYQ